ncbi:MAG: hypothetical protein ACO32T_06670 [Candidatus Nanopelagicaceae bacterium]
MPKFDALYYTSSRGNTMNATELQELRQTILEEVEDMDIDMLKRIAYECRCEENGIYPDQTYIRWQ